MTPPHLLGEVGREKQAKVGGRRGAASSSLPSPDSGEGKHALRRGRAPGAARAVAGIGPRLLGGDEEDARRHGVDALEVGLASYILARRPIPDPSPARGRPTVSPSLLGRLKIELYRAMRASGMKKADLARRLELDPRQVDRLLDLAHESRTEQLEAALAALGKRVILNVRDAA